jgi:hypothetical protein
MTWQAAGRELAALTARFYNRNPAARILILGGPASSDSYRAQILLIQRLGAMVERVFAAYGVVLPPSSPNVALLCVEIGSACYRVSYFLHGKVTPEYEREAGSAMIAYMTPYVGS